MRTRRLVAATAALAILAAGCASHGPDSRVTTLRTATPQAAASGTMSLRTAGFTYGPDLALPTGIRIERRVDQANVVSVFFREPAGPEAAGFFRTALPAAGIPVTADANGALLASGGGWSAAFATGADGVSGLTLRRDA